MPVSSAPTRLVKGCAWKIFLASAVSSSIDFGPHVVVQAFVNVVLEHREKPFGETEDMRPVGSPREILLHVFGNRKVLLIEDGVVGEEEPLLQGALSARPL